MRGGRNIIRSWLETWFAGGSWEAFDYHPGTARSPLSFFLLVFALTAPFWMIGAVTGFQLLPAATVDWTGPSG
jgi:hypothetical protein